MIVHRHSEPYKNGHLIAEDWPTQEHAFNAARLAVEILRVNSGYAGSRDLDDVADFIIPLLGLDRGRPYGMSLLLENE